VRCARAPATTAARAPRGPGSTRSPATCWSTTRGALAAVVAELDRRIEALPEREALAHALATLSDEEREAVALRFGADLTVPEMAELTGEPLTTVEGRVYRALRKLRTAMDPERLGRPGA
jgi:RNA polymerase sigma factor (sigma-70 family)